MAGGRPTKYDPAICETVKKLCLLGATDKEMADILGVCEQTFNSWKGQHPEFLEALKEGKGVADANVAHRLYQRAMGYSHPAVKIVADAKSGAEVQVPYIEHYPPDTTACIFWLKNRQKDKWRDRTEHDVKVKTTLEDLVAGDED